MASKVRGNFSSMRLSIHEDEKSQIVFICLKTFVQFCAGLPQSIKNLHSRYNSKVTFRYISYIFEDEKSISQNLFICQNVLYTFALIYRKEFFLIAQEV
jgi:hypothetical protein